MLEDRERRVLLQIAVRKRHLDEALVVANTDPSLPWEAHVWHDLATDPFVYQTLEIPDELEP